uniref:Uncharacterized protein n=1 Tax=Arundo donax TaxID=35708 RepID=A0A0A9TWY7_ARUDO
MYLLRKSKRSINIEIFLSISGIYECYGNCEDKLLIEVSMDRFPMILRHGCGLGIVLTLDF